MPALHDPLPPVAARRGPKPKGARVMSAAERMAAARQRQRVAGLRRVEVVLPAAWLELLAPAAGTGARKLGRARLNALGREAFRLLLQSRGLGGATPQHAAGVGDAAGAG